MSDDPTFVKNWLEKCPHLSWCLYYFSPADWSCGLVAAREAASDLVLEDDE